LSDLEFIKRDACKLCDDFSAEYADICFGGLGAKEGWTTVITRTPLGRAVLAYALGESLESFPYEENPKYITLAQDKILMVSKSKKDRAAQNRID
jgi:coenzyme F420 hydrogenase subunit beta